MNPEKINAVRALVDQAERILFITGAGLSAGSGLPTYRGIGGLYEGRLTSHGIPIEEALSGTMFRKQPDVSWEYLWEIAEVLRGAAPNRGHEIISEIEVAKPGSWVLTQNVDGLHAAAGTKNLIEIHGRAGTLRCVDCGIEFDGEEILWETDRDKRGVPQCPCCDGVLKPTVVLFGEMLPEEEMGKYAALVDKGIDLVVSVGTSNQFAYITEPVEMAAGMGIPTVDINTGDSGLGEIVDHVISTDAVAALEAIHGKKQETDFAKL